MRYEENEKFPAPSRGSVILVWEKGNFTNGIDRIDLNLPSTHCPITQRKLKKTRKKYCSPPQMRRTSERASERAIHNVID